MWAQALTPLLSLEAQLAYFALPPASAEEYPLLKLQILAQCKFTSCQAAAEFHRWMCQAKFSPCSQMDSLLRTTKRLLKPKQYSVIQVAEWVTVDRFLLSLPPAECVAVGMRAPQTTAGWLKLLKAP